MRRDLERQEEKIEKDRQEQRMKATKKQNIFKEKQAQKEKTRRITEMLASLPTTEKEKIEKEERRKDNLELKEIKENLWKKWRGKDKTKERKIKILSLPNRTK